MAHIEHLGTQTLHLVIDPSQVRRGRNGGAFIATMNGSTKTLLRFSPEAAMSIPKRPSYATIEGPSDLHITVEDDCSLTGVQTLEVEDILVVDRAEARAPEDHQLADLFA